MTYIWNIYEPCDPQDLTDDPYDIFIYSLHKDEVPHVGDLVYVEGCNHRVVACKPDYGRTEVMVVDDAVIYKVCIV